MQLSIFPQAAGRCHHRCLLRSQIGQFLSIISEKVTSTGRPEQHS